MAERSNQSTKQQSVNKYGQDKLRQIQGLSLILILAGVLVLVIHGIIGTYRIEDDSNDLTHEAYERFMNVGTLSLTNRAELTDSISNSNSLIVHYIMSRVVLDPAERATAPNENIAVEGLPAVFFTGTIKDLQSRSNPNDARGSSSISSFILDLSDGRMYEVNVLISVNAGYIAVLITRDGAQYLFADSRRGDGWVDPDILRWAENIMGPGYDDLEIEFIN